MNKSKGSTSLIVIVIALVVIGLIVWFGRTPSNVTPSFEAEGDAPVAVSETTKVSGSVSEYQNAELGFSVKYPTSWEKEEANSGVNFVIPIDKSQVSTIATLQANVQVLPGTCAFPPVTTIKDRSTLKVGENTFNMISMSNTVQTRTYFNRMYSLQSEGICYMFSLASIDFTPASKGLTGSQVTQAQNNNKAIIATADSDFQSMIKSFAFVVLPAGSDETKAAPGK
ncbi:MAG: hypothetical protein WCV79_01685 [Candidatus Paceibacterota bacterium]